MSKGQPKEGMERSYKKRQTDSFAYLETTANQWRACEISGMNQITGEVDFAIPGYTIVKPITDRLLADQLAQLQDKLAASDWAKGLCELCGALIKVPYPIRHDAKKLVMFIGSECVTNYTKAGREYKQKKKEFKDKLLKNLFGVWISIAITDVWTIGKEEHSDRLELKYFLLLKKLEKAQSGIDDLSAIKMRNLFKKAHKLGISIPIDYIPKEEDG